MRLPILSYQWPSLTKEQQLRHFQNFFFRGCALLLAALVILMLVLEAWCAKLDREALAGFSNCDHGATLTEVITELRLEAYPYEVVAIFDRDGQKLVEYTSYDPYHVSIPPQITRALRRQEGLTHLHNHPHVLEATFSLGDLRTFSQTHGLDRAIVIGATQTYQLEHNGASWPSESATIAWLVSTLANGDLSSLESSKYLTPTTAPGGRTAYCSTDALLEDYADRFNLSYTVT